MTKVLSHTVHFRNTVAQHTLGHIDCPVCERARTMSLASISPSTPFAAAAVLWLESRSRNPLNGPARGPGRRNGKGQLRPNTIHSYSQFIVSLGLFFGDMPLEKIHLGHILAYQEARRNGDPPFIRKRRPIKSCEPAPSPVKEGKVNQELSCLHMIMETAGCWTREIEDGYVPHLIEVSEKERALTYDERLHWLATARQKPRWEVVYLYSLAAFDTSAATNEMRSLRIGDINLFHRTITIPPAGAKNHARARVIPLVTAEVLWALEKLLTRAEYLGCRSPQHFLLPFRGRDHQFQPTRPMTVNGIRVPWDEVRLEAGKGEFKGILDFTPYHTRHTALTHWAEGGMTIEEMMPLAGHLTPAQTREYARISQGAIRKARERAEQMRQEEREFMRKQPRSVGVERKKAWG